MIYINNKKLNYRGNNRPQAFWGALIPAAINFVGGLISSSQQSRAQKRAIEEQKRLAQQQLEVSNQNNLAATLNNYASAQNSYDDKDYNLKYRNGGTKRLGSNSIVITDGGNARKVGNNTFLLRGGSHEDINETGQTGIGINVGGNEIEAEGGEVAQKKNNSVRIFSAQPMLAGGLSPAQAILRGYSKDKVFAAQQRFKRNNHLNDDGSKAKYGNEVPKKRLHVNEDGTLTDTLNGSKVTKAKHTTIRPDGTIDYNSGFTPNNGQAATMGLSDPLFQVITLGKSMKLNRLVQAIKAHNKIRNNKINISKEYRDKNDVYKEYGKFAFDLVNPLFRNGGKIKYNKPDYYHWMNQTSNNLKVSPIDSTYDYRAYYNSATPWELANTMYNAKNGHFTDVGKRPSHPTFSNESKYSNSKTPGGTWNGDVFVPAIWQFGNNGNKIRNRYMNNTGESYFDGRRNVYPKYRIGGRVKAKDGTSISLNSSYSNKDLLSIITEGHPTARKIVDEIFGSAGDRRKFINDLNFLGLGSDDASSIAGASPIFRQPIVSAAKQARYVQEANKARQTANANKARQTASYTEKQANQTEPFIDYLGKELKNVGNKLGINIDYIPTTYTPTNLGFAIDQAARNMTKGANPFLYTNSSTINKTAKNILNGSKKVYTNVKGKVVNPNTYRYSKDARRVRDASGRLIWQPNYKLRPWVKGAAVATGAGLLTGIGAGLSNLETEDEKTQRELNDYGKPISPYIARPNTKQTSNRTRKDTVNQLPDSIRRPIAKKDSVVTPVFKQALGKDSVRRDSVKPTRTVAKPQQKVIPVKQDTTRVDTTKQLKATPQQKKVITPQYKGNVTKGNYQLHDGESKVINGVKYTRIGNNIFNHKTNVSYVYDKNGNYTGQADYSKVGKNFNDDFDAARAAGRSNFIYNAGKYRNYSTAKEEDAKKEARNRAVGLKRIAKKCGGLITPRRKYVDGGDANILSGTTIYAKNRRNYTDWNRFKNNYVWNNLLKGNMTYLPFNVNYSNKTPQVNNVISSPDSSSNSSVLSTAFSGRQNSFKPATQDYIGLGIDTLAALGSGIFTRSAYNKLNFDYNLPTYVDETPVAFDTTYHNEAQRANVERNRINGRNLIQGNTSSAQTALSRMQEGDTNAMMELNKLADEKSNKEVELRNQNAANEQQVRARNVAARNQYYQNVAQIQNAALEAKNNAALAKAQSIGTDLSGLAQAWSNFATSIENRYDSRQNQIAMVASANNPNVTQTALRMGYDFSPETLAGLYNTSTDENLKRLILSKMSTRDRIKYGIQ